jgi:predicted permease
MAMTSFWQDLRIGLRMLAKKPGLTAIVVLALALGLGVNTFVFNVVNSLLVRPLRIPRPEQLVSIYTGSEADVLPRSQVSYPDYRVLRGEDGIFEGVFATHFNQYAFVQDTGQGLPRYASEALTAEVVTGNYFEVLGVRPQLGRTFDSKEGDDPGAAPVVVLSDVIWRRRFNADPAVLGRKVTINSATMTIIGVMPPSFGGVMTGDYGIEYWFPLAVKPRAEPGNDGWLRDRTRREVSVFARLRPGVTLAQANARVEVVGRNLAAAFPLSNAGLAMHAVSEIQGRWGTSYQAVRMGCLMAMLLAGLVLIICCANVANLLLASAASRSKELGIRLALGASRMRIVRQLMTESLLLALMGGALGLVVASWLPDLLHAFLPPLPFGVQTVIPLDAGTMVWGLAVAVVSGFLFGSLPAWRASHADLVTSLKTDLGAQGQKFRRGSLRHALVVAQIAISVVVVMTGGLIARSLDKLQKVDPGFDPDTLVSAQLNPGLFEAFGAGSDPKLALYFEELQRRLERLPGARSVASSSYMPLVNYTTPKGPVVREGDPPPPPNQGATTGYSIVFPRYFETVGTQLLRGRDFQPQERKGTPATVIVNAELARRLYGGPDQALGKRFRVGGPEAPLLQIVGVARDGRYRNLFEAPTSWVFLPGCPDGLGCGDLTFRSILVRAESQAQMPALAEGLRREAAALDPRLPVEIEQVGRGHLAPLLHTSRLAAELGAVLALMALALATLGIYSLMTYAVSQRTKEIGIRMALGGQVGDVLALVLRQGLGLTVVGVGLGAVGAVVVGRLVGGFLYGVSGSDPLTIAATLTILVTTALVATLFPARRAARVSPMVAIRYDQSR